MTEPRPNRRIQIVAVGFAAAALVTAVVAVVVVATRPAPEPPPAPPPPTNTVEDRRVNAEDVIKLDKSSTNSLWSIVPDGIRIDDADLRKALKLDRDDVITALSGHPLRREREVHRAVFDMSLSTATTVYVDVIHDHHPVLYRWNVDGDLRGARRASYDTTGSGSGSGGAFDPLTGSGTGLVLPMPPPDPPPPDPLAATVKSIDDFHVEVPSTTVDQVLANPMAMARGARIVPSVKNGHPHGFKLYAIRPSSVCAALHFQNGDTILTLNGEDIGDASRAMDAYTKLRSAKRLVIGIERRGQPATLTIDIK